MELEKIRSKDLKSTKQLNRPLGLSFDMSDLYTKYMVSRNQVRDLKSSENNKHMNVKHVDVNLLNCGVSRND